MEDLTVVTPETAPSAYTVENVKTSVIMEERTDKAIKSYSDYIEVENDSENPQQSVS